MHAAFEINKETRGQKTNQIRNNNKVKGQMRRKRGSVYEKHAMPKSTKSESCHWNSG